MISLLLFYFLLCLSVPSLSCPLSPPLFSLLYVLIASLLYASLIFLFFSFCKRKIPFLVLRAGTNDFPASQHINKEEAFLFTFLNFFIFTHQISFQLHIFFQMSFPMCQFISRYASCPPPSCFSMSVCFSVTMSVCLNMSLSQVLNKTHTQ